MSTVKTTKPKGTYQLFHSNPQKSTMRYPVPCGFHICKSQQSPHTAFFFDDQRGLHLLLLLAVTADWIQPRIIHLNQITHIIIVNKCDPILWLTLFQDGNKRIPFRCLKNSKCHLTSSIINLRNSLPEDVVGSHRLRRLLKAIRQILGRWVS